MLTIIPFGRWMAQSEHKQSSVDIAEHAAASHPACATRVTGWQMV
jgi:hypothetical protein